MNRLSWRGSMASQVFMVLLVGVVTAAALALTSASFERRQSDQRARAQRLVDRIADLKTAMDGAPAVLRPDLLGVGPEAARLARGDVRIGQPDAGLTLMLQARMGVGARPVASNPPDDACAPPPGPPAPPGPDPALRPPPPPPAGTDAPRPPPPGCRLVTMTLHDGDRVALILPTGPRAPPPEHSPLGVVFLSVLGLAAAALAFIVARMATAPLSRLSSAATALGRDLDRPPLAIEGPSEVREAATAFNAMQVRLKQHLAERTQMLAAITHDLQTPLTRQRLRLEKVSDPELRDQLLADQSAMQEMIRDGLDLARLSSEMEALEELDVSSLLQALCDDALAADCVVTVSGEPGLLVRTRPLALRRCIANLLDNALKYAGSAELSAHRDERLIIQVNDCGPGIPPHQLDAVLQPFHRLESSRSRQTGGVGLGLTIANVLAERSGAILTLANRAEGGLSASVAFSNHDLQNRTKPLEPTRSSAKGRRLG